MAQRTCSIEGCEREHAARGFCLRCYKDRRASGELELVQEQLPWPKNLLQRMEPQPDGCIHFTGLIDNYGYGRIEYAGGVKAHRAAYELFIGPIPDGMTLDHECHNRSGCTITDRTCPHRRCVNPEHLAPKPSGDNTLSSPNTIASINAAKTHCPQGHPYDEENTYVGPKYGDRQCRICRADSK